MIFRGLGLNVFLGIQRAQGRFGALGFWVVGFGL